MRLLIIDDNEINLRVIRAMLKPYSFEITEATSAQSGIALAWQERPDLILMDIRMPDMDGLEATRKLRSMPETSAIPIIAVSAQAMVGDREQALEAGCMAYVTKPVAQKALFLAIDQALRARKNTRSLEGSSLPT